MIVGMVTNQGTNAGLQAGVVIEWAEADAPGLESGWTAIPEIHGNVTGTGVNTGVQVDVRVRLRHPAGPPVGHGPAGTAAR